MNKKVLVVVVIVAITIFTCTIFAIPTAKKASAEILGNPNSIITYATLWDKNKENYSAVFENSFKSCKIIAGPQKRYVQVENAEISGLASLLAKSKKTEFEKTRVLFDFAAENISYNVYKNWRYPDEILQTRDGDCTDKSVLLVSMLKNVGIDAYVVYGKKVNDYSHAWVAAKISGKWIQIDPTAKEFYYLYDCKKDENCKYNDYYEIEGMFDDNVVLKCEVN